MCGFDWKRVCFRQQKSHALQCIRFLVENNFLQDLGKKPLMFPCESEGEEEQEQVQDLAGSESDDERSENQAEMKSKTSSESEDNDSVQDQ